MAAGAGGAGYPPWGGARALPPLLFRSLRGGGCGGRGMLSGSGAVRPGVRAPWAPHCSVVGSGVVGGLVVNCIVDASIYNM